MKIFFDVDGVLIDGWHADEARRKPWDLNIEKDLGVDRLAFEHLFFKAGPTPPMNECVAGRCDLKAALAEVLPQVGYKGEIDAFVRYWFEKDSNVNTSVFQLIRKIRDHGSVRLFVATGQEHHRAQYLWNDLGFSTYFEDIFYSARIGFLKNDRRFFESINRILEIAPGEEILFFDDQPTVVELARQAGWSATQFQSANDILNHPRLGHFWR